MAVRSAPASDRLPDPIVWTLIVVSLLPAALSLLGFDFGSTATDLTSPLITMTFDSLDPQLRGEEIQRWMTGSLVHTLLEWTALIIALLTAALAYVHHRMTGQLVTLVMSLALLFAGACDAFHVLASDGLVAGQTEPEQFGPFTWTISRLFRATVLFVGAWVVTREGRAASAGVALGLAGTLFAVMAFGIVQTWGASEALPRSMFPDSSVPRPWDLVPLALFAVGGVGVFPRLHRLQPSVFTHALTIGCIPEVVAQAHAAFGSAELFDSHSNLASFVKIIAYLVPFIGLLVAYVATLDQQSAARARLETEVDERRRAQAQLAEHVERLAASNRELEDFAYIASHDLNEPLRKVMAFGDRLRARSADKLDPRSQDYLQRMQAATVRMQTLIRDLLVLSRVTTRGNPFETCDVSAMLDDVVSDLQIRVEDTDGQVISEAIPPLAADPLQIRQLLQNLVGNALKFHREGVPPIVRVSGREITVPPDGMAPARDADRWLLLEVADNGIGFETRYLDRIFQPFQRLHGRGTFEGTGIGLAIVRKIAERHGGAITAESEPGSGSRFRILLPMEQEEEAATLTSTEVTKNTPE